MYLYCCNLYTKYAESKLEGAGGGRGHGWGVCECVCVCGWVGGVSGSNLYTKYVEPYNGRVIGIFKIGGGGRIRGGGGGGGAGQCVCVCVCV